MSVLEGLDEVKIRKLLLQAISWRVGDMPALVSELVKNFSLTEYEAIQLLETICPVIDYTINKNPESVDDIIKIWSIYQSKSLKAML